jgi:hypothetical protein
VSVTLLEAVAIAGGAVGAAVLLLYLFGPKD